MGLIVGIFGPARSGKDTAGVALEALGLHRLAFADPLRAMALRIDPMVAVDGHRHVHLAHVVDEVGWESAKKLGEVRRFLQRLGAEGLREIDTEFWIRLADREVDAHPEGVVITDVRFPNEADYVRARGGLLVRISRPHLGLDDDEYRTHSSESHYDAMPYDIHIVNDCPPPEFGARVIAAVQTAVFHRRPA